MNEEKPYRLPDPEKNPDAFLVLVYKTLKAVPFDDRGWDKIYFARCMKRAQALLENLGQDVQAAARCMSDLKDKFDADGLSWTIETIVQYSFEWRSEQMRLDPKDCVRGLASAYKNSKIAGWLTAPSRRNEDLPKPPPKPCDHWNLQRSPGKETKCPDCPTMVYTPTAEEIGKLKKGLAPREMPAA